jgi:hypothetical protein
MKSFLAIALLCTFAGAANADPSHPTRSRAAMVQDEGEADNSFFVEGGGPGLLYSINYERRVEQDWGLRIGFSYVSISASATAGGSTASANASFISVPVTVNYLGVSSGNHALELAAGGTAVFASGSASGTGIAASGSGMIPLGTVSVGYRRQPLDGGFQFRIGLEALMGKGLALSNPDPNSFGVLPWMYMSLGFSL